MKYRCNVKYSLCPLRVYNSHSLVCNKQRAVNEQVQKTGGYRDIFRYSIYIYIYTQECPSNMLLSSRGLVGRKSRNGSHKRINKIDNARAEGKTTRPATPRCSRGGSFTGRICRTPRMHSDALARRANAPFEATRRDAT